MPAPDLQRHFTESVSGIPQFPSSWLSRLSARWSSCWRGCCPRLRLSASFPFGSFKPLAACCYMYGFYPLLQVQCVITGRRIIWLSDSFEGCIWARDFFTNWTAMGAHRVIAHNQILVAGPRLKVWDFHSWCSASFVSSQQSTRSPP